MKICLIIAWLGNIIDTISTLYLCGNGYAVEVNPLMHWLLQCPVVFAIVKIGFMTAIVSWLWCSRENRYARIATTIGTMIYSGIAVYYMILFSMLL